MYCGGGAECAERPRHRLQTRLHGCPSRRDRRARAAEGGPDDAVAVSEHDREQRPKHDRRDAVQRGPTGNGKLDPVSIERLRRTQRLEEVRVPPDRERSRDLLIAESPAIDVAAVTHRPADARPTDADRHGDASPVANAALLLLDACQRRGRQRRERSGLFVPAEDVGRWCVDDRGIREHGPSSWHGAPTARSAIRRSIPRNTSA